MPGASHPAVTSDARCGRKLLAEQEVVSDISYLRTAVTSATSCRTSGWFGLLVAPVDYPVVVFDVLLPDLMTVRGP